MAIDTAAKRAAAAHVKRAGKGVTPDAARPEIWRAAVAWNYGGNSLTPPTPGTGARRELMTLGSKLSMDISPDPPFGGRGSW